MNGLRATLAEFGVAAAPGYRGLADLRAHLASPESGLPETLVTALGLLSQQFDALTPSIEAQRASPTGNAIRARLLLDKIRNFVHAVPISGIDAPSLRPGEERGCLTSLETVT